MESERTRWAEALAILRWKGDDTDAYLSERVAALARAGDDAGVDRFIALACLIDRLRKGTVH